MTNQRDAILKRLTGTAIDSPPLFLPDLTLWHKWHSQRGTLPAGCGPSLPDAARTLGVPIWTVYRPWQASTPGIETRMTDSADERMIQHVTAQGTLTARWQLGPDGDWWQVEYPVKTADDLPAAQAVVAARHYIVVTDGLAQAAAAAGDDGVLALELPMQPFSDLLHTLLGWGEGLLLLGSHKEVVRSMLGLLDERLSELAGALAALPGDLLLAPDNLDGQYVSPRSFRDFMAASYRRTADQAHAHGKPLLVHVGGPVRRLLPLLAEAGLDAVEGIAGAPQSDATLAEARQAAGPALALWGGIPQDYLVGERSQEEFEAAAAEAIAQCREDGRMLLGVADRVPVDADWERLRMIPNLCAGP